MKKNIEITFPSTLWPIHVHEAGLLMDYGCAVSSHDASTIHNFIPKYESIFAHLQLFIVTAQFMLFQDKHADFLKI